MQLAAAAEGDQTRDGIVGTQELVARAEGILRVADPVDIEADFQVMGAQSVEGRQVQVGQTLVAATLARGVQEGVAGATIVGVDERKVSLRD